MSSNKDRTLEKLEHAIITGKKDESRKYAVRALDEGVNPMEAVDSALIRAMRIIGDRYSDHRIFLPQVLLAADAMYAAMDVLLPRIPKDDSPKTVTLVIGVVEGDVHDIGKNIVKAMFTAAGFVVHDLGKDQPDEAFVAAAKRTKAQIVAMSTLMTPTMDSMKETIDALVEDGYRKHVKVMVGGAPVSQEFADEVGADLYAQNAQEAVKKIKSTF
jgi:dimethylamine corrinoid protein